jgi:hypothetical protein
LKHRIAIPGMDTAAWTLPVMQRACGAEAIVDDET